MKISSRARYAVTAMLDIALLAEGEYLTLTDISERQGISLSYLEKIFAKLRKKNLVQSNRGPKGGYRIIKPLNQISILDIIEALEENIDVRRCKGQEDCKGGGRCDSHALWNKLSQHMQTLLASISIADLLHENRLVQDL